MSPREAASDLLARDAPLVARLQSGDATALRDLIAVYGAMLLRYATRIVDADDIAEDVLQAVLWRLWQQRDVIRRDAPLAPLLFRLTRNEAIDVNRSTRSGEARDARWARERDTDTPFARNSGEIASEMADEAANLRADILRALDDVPARSREVFLLAWEEQLAPPVIAEVLGVSVGTVRNQMTRAVQRLVQVFGSRHREG